MLLSSVVLSCLLRVALQLICLQFSSRILCRGIRGVARRSRQDTIKGLVCGTGERLFEDSDGVWKGVSGCTYLGLFCAPLLGLASRFWLWKERQRMLLWLVVTLYIVYSFSFYKVFFVFRFLVMLTMLHAPSNKADKSLHLVGRVKAAWSEPALQSL